MTAQEVRQHSSDSTPVSGRVDHRYQISMETQSPTGEPRCRGESISSSFLSSLYLVKDTAEPPLVRIGCWLVIMSDQSSRVLGSRQSRHSNYIEVYHDRNQCMGLINI